MLRVSTPGCQSRASAHSPHSGESRNPSHPLSQGDFTPLHVHRRPPSKPTLHHRDLRHPERRGRCGEGASATSRRHLRPRRTRPSVKCGSNPRDSTRRPTCPTAPDTRSCNSPSATTSPSRPAQITCAPPRLRLSPKVPSLPMLNSNAAIILRLPLQRTREGRGLALLKLSQECQRDVHGVRRHPTNIVFGVQVPESPNQRA